MFVLILSVIALITAVIHIRAEYKGPPLHIYIFKPLTTSLIILIVIVEKNTVSPIYQYLILLGLLFSLSGDVFLMLPSDQFIGGLVSFLIAHLFYIAAFVNDAQTAVGWVLIPLLIYGGIIYFYLSPHVGKLKIPVVVYMLAILAMAWQAWSRWLVQNNTGALLALVGAILFVISDSVLALNRFRRPFKLARLLTMGTYYSAQWFIALSVIGF